MWNASPKDFKSGEVTGTVAATRLPDGAYQIQEYECVMVTGMMTAVSRRPVVPPIRFEIKAGQTAYVGRFSLMTTRAGLLPGGSAALVRSDEQSFDLAVASRRFPTITGTDVRSFVTATPP